MLWMLSIATAAATPDASLPLEATSYTVDVTGPLAEVVIRQTFRNQAADFVDATYLFPLDHDAVVDGMVMRIGDRTVRSEILGRERARDVWTEAANNGQIAALTEQQRPNVFTQDVSNLPPGERIEVELRLVQPIDRADGAWELVLPLVVAPRFVRPGDGGGAAVLASYRVPAEADVAAPAAAGEEGRRVLADLDVVLHATAPIHHLASPSHQPQIALDGLDASVVLDDTPMTRDFVLQWRTDGDEPQLGVLKAGRHAMLMMEVPPVVPRADRAGRELIWVVDTSGSMGGDKIALAQRAMIGALDTMDARDSFVVLGFGDEVRQATDRPVPATPLNRQRGRAFVRSLKASGGTWMERALHAALAFPDDPHRRRMVVFLTDGQIGHDTELLRKIAESAGETTFVALGIGSAPNQYLLDEMARLGGGVSAYAEGPDDLLRLVETMERPVLTDFRIDWGDCEASLVSPAAVPTLRPGHPVHLLARIDGACTERVRVEALGDCRVTFELAPREVPHDRAVASTFARSQVADLERRAMRGEIADPSAEIEAVGLEYGIVTSQTSRVAVDSLVVDPSGGARPVRVPLDLPDGEPIVASAEEIAVMSTATGRVMTKEFVQRIPAGRTYQNAVTTAPGVTGGGSGNPNMAGSASNENTYLLDGANITDPVTGTFSLNYDSGAWRRSGLDPLALARLPEHGAGPAGFQLQREPSNRSEVTAEARGAGFSGDPTAAALGSGSVAGPVVPDRLWVDLEAGGRQASLDGTSTLTGRTVGRLDSAPANGHRLRAGAAAAAGAVRADGRSVAFGSVGADGAWTWSRGSSGLKLDGGWARRTLADAARDRFGVDGTYRLALGHHTVAVGGGGSRVAWAGAGAPSLRQDAVSGFVQDVWDVTGGLKVSGGLRVDALTAPGLVMASPRLLASLDPGQDGRTKLAAGYSVYRDTSRVLPAALTDVRMPRESELLLLGEHALTRGLRLSLAGAWSRQRLAFQVDPALSLLPADRAEGVERDVATVTTGLTARVATLQLAAAWRFRPQLGAAPPDLLADEAAPFVPGFLDAYRAHAVDVDLRWETPWSLVLASHGGWAAAVSGGDGAWWLAPRLTVGGSVEHWLGLRAGALALTASVTVSSNDPAASVLPLEAYTLGLGAVPSIGDQPPIRGELGLKLHY
jgi:Ca-activated chloride channel homolog